MIDETPRGATAPGAPRDAEAEGRDVATGPAGEGEGEGDAGRRTRRSEFEDLAVEAERLVREGIDQAERRIRRHPLTAVGLAAGVGLMLGLLVGRDR